MKPGPVRPGHAQVKTLVGQQTAGGAWPLAIENENRGFLRIADDIIRRTREFKHNCTTHVGRSVVDRKDAFVRGIDWL